MERLRALIVDDERLARQRLRALLEELPEIDVDEATDGFDALEKLSVDTFGVVFLDIQMPELDGFLMLQELGEPRPLIVFVTAFEEHAVRAFEVLAFDYLLKPVDAGRLQLTVDRVRRRLREPPHSRRKLERFVVRRADRIYLLPVAKVSWLKAEGNYVRVHAGAESYLVRATLSALAEVLERPFARIHRSIIVNLDRVREIETFEHGDYEVVLDDGTQLPLSRTYRDAILRPDV